MVNTSFCSISKFFLPFFLDSSTQSYFLNQVNKMMQKVACLYALRYLIKQNLKIFKPLIIDVPLLLAFFYLLSLVLLPIFKVSILIYFSFFLIIWLLVFSIVLRHLLEFFFHLHIRMALSGFFLFFFFLGVKIFHFSIMVFV